MSRSRDQLGEEIQTTIRPRIFNAECAVRFQAVSTYLVDIRIMKGLSEEDDKLTKKGISDFVAVIEVASGQKLKYTPVTVTAKFKKSGVILVFV